MWCGGVEYKEDQMMGQRDGCTTDNSTATLVGVAANGANGNEGEQRVDGEAKLVSLPRWRGDERLTKPSSPRLV